MNLREKQSQDERKKKEKQTIATKRKTNNCSPLANTSLENKLNATPPALAAAISDPKRLAEVIVARAE
jgi:hypothetical protein